MSGVTPEQRELEAKRKRLAELQASLAACELEVCTLRANLNGFQSRFLTNPAGQAQPWRFQPSDDLKHLYSEAVKSIHPHLAEAGSERDRRRRAMAQVASAYERGDEQEMRSLLKQWEAKPEIVGTEDIGAQLVRVVRHIDRIERHIEQARQELAELKRWDTYDLMRWVMWNESQGYDPRRELDLSDTGLTDGHLARLVDLCELRKLDLRRVKVTDAGLAHLARLENLVWLDLGYTTKRVTSAGMAHLAALRRMEVLKLRSTGVDDSGLVHLTDLQELRELDLAYTNVTDEGLPHLANLPQLRELDLSVTAVTDAGLAHLARLPRLRKLWLWDTDVTDAGLEHLSGLTELEELWLFRTRVTDAGLKCLEGLPHLRKLDVDETDVTAEGRTRLSTRLPQLDFVWHSNRYGYRPKRR